MATRQFTWSEQYKVGVQLNKVVQHECTLQQVADELGITKQNAYTETVVTLGKFMLLFRQRLNLPLFKVCPHD